MVCGACKRKTEHLGIRIKTVCCIPGGIRICKDCCIKNGGKKCHWWAVCWDTIA